MPKPRDPKPQPAGRAALRLLRAERPAPPDGPLTISPRMDLVFQRIFGAPGSEPILVDLLNGVLRPPRPFVEVSLINPVLSPDTVEGRLIIVDLVAVDDRGARVQVEMQTSPHGHLRPRMLHGWARLYSGQLSAGEDFAALRPVISLWFCDRNVLPPPPPGRAEPFHARFEIGEPGGGPSPFDHFSLHIIELARFRAAHRVPTPDHRWLHFLAEAEAWQGVPPLLHSTPLEAAMTTLSAIRSDPTKRALVEGYYKQLSIEATLARELEEQKQALEEQKRALAEQERALAEQERAMAEQERALADNERAMAEQERALAEQERAMAEQERALAEQERAMAEQERALAEQERAMAEQERALAEQERAMAEQERALADNERALADNERAMAEQERALAEATQILRAEQARAERAEAAQRAEQAKAEAERAKVEALRAKLRALGIDPEAEAGGDA